MWLLFRFLVLILVASRCFPQSPPVVPPTATSQAPVVPSASAAGPAWTVSPFHPHAIPLAVRSPFLNCWAVGGNGSAPLSEQWPMLQDMKSILGWALFVSVDSVAYRIVGAAGLAPGAQVAKQTGFSFTATKTNFVHTAGGMTVTTSFISPIEPSNLVLQSLPAAYVSVSVKSNDNNRHVVQVYSDISGEWISGDNALTETWNTTVSSSYVIHSAVLQQPGTFTVVNNHIQDATAYYGIVNGEGITWQTGAAVPLRSQFMTQGRLLNTKDTDFRAVSKDFPVIALSQDLGNIAITNAPVVFALGLLRDPAIRTLSLTGNVEDRSLYFFTQFPSALDAMEYFISDFARADSAASTFDSSVRSAASTVSSDYADLIDLSVRQVLATIEITVGKDSEGNWNKSDIRAFMNDGGGQISAVDIMYPAFPVFLQTNPVIAGALLKPLLQLQQLQQSNSLPWAAHDLGTQYPVTLGISKNLIMPVEESANMLIMTLAQARASGDATLVVNYYKVLDKWAQYLVSNAINPGNQNFTDSFLTGFVVNDTNLALKGIIGIQAMAGIAAAVNNSAAATKYHDIASSLITQWVPLAFSADQSHLLLNFGNESSSLGLPYNLYADKLLGLNMIPQKVYDQATAFVKSHLQTFGVPMDSRSSTASKTDWMLFTAAALSDTDTRNALISAVRKYAANLMSRAVPFSDFYDVVQGTSILFQSRPVQGAMYSILALQTPSRPITLPPSVPSGGSHKNSAPSCNHYGLGQALALGIFLMLASSGVRAY